MFGGEVSRYHNYLLQALVCTYMERTNSPVSDMNQKLSSTAVNRHKAS